MNQDHDEQKNKHPEFISPPYIDEFLKKYELERVHADFAERLILLVIAGLGLVTALAWDEFFKEIFAHLFQGLSTLTETLLYAAFLTIFTAAVSVVLTRLFRKKTEGK